MERPKHVFVVHGDDEVCDTFAATVKEKFGMEADAPFSGTSYDLKEGCFITVTEGIPIKREAEPAKRPQVYSGVWWLPVKGCAELF